MLGQGRCLVNVCGMHGHAWGTFPPVIFTAFKAFNPGVASSREILACFWKMAATIKRDSAHSPSVWRGRVPATLPSKMCLGNSESTWKKSIYPGPSVQSSADLRETERSRRREAPQLIKFQLYEFPS